MFFQLRFAVQLLRQPEQRIRDQLQPGSDNVLLLTLTQSQRRIGHARRSLNAKVMVLERAIFAKQKPRNVSDETRLLPYKAQ